jgi:hypothetical protein
VTVRGSSGQQVTWAGVREPRSRARVQTWSKWEQVSHAAQGLHRAQK